MNGWNGWMDGWMDGWMSGWMGGWVDNHVCIYTHTGDDERHSLLKSSSTVGREGLPSR